MKPPRQCAVKNCNNPIAYQIHFSLAVHANHPPAISTPILYVCEEHKNEFTFEMLAVEPSWKAICDMFLSIGRQAPKKEFSKIILAKAQSDPELS